MIRLENIFLEYGIRLLDVANNNENPTFGELIDKPIAGIKAIMLELLAPYDYSEFDEVTSAIADIRKKVEEL